MGNDPLAIYVHWPYCARICPYCDFNVYKGRQDDGLLSAILKDLEHWRSWSGPRDIVSVHFGGGTPSLMRGDNIKAVIEKTDSLWGVPKTAEIGLEANPNDADPDNWQSFRVAGINRLSLGVQSFKDSALKFLGRDHMGAQAQQAAKLAKDIFPNVSLDLIFGWAGQTPADLATDLDQALDLKPNHLSTYQLTIEEGTAFERAERRGEVRAVDNDQSAAFYDVVVARLTTAGYDHYEISNFARPGFESRHNLSYWRGYDYVGTGPGAHGRLIKDGIKYATIAHQRPNDYLDAVQKSGHGIHDTETMSGPERAAEYVLMGLRTSEGISMVTYAQMAQVALPETELVALMDAGLLQAYDDRLSATEKGRPLLDYITQKLLS